MNFLFRNGRVIDPSQALDEVMDVLILDGRIAEIRHNIDVGRDRLVGIEELDVSGSWIVPGLLDMHVHLREPGEEYKETIASGTRAAVAGGFVGVACMPNTHPVNDNVTVTKFILNRAREEGACQVFPVGAISEGLRGEALSEFGELKKAGVVALTDDGRPVMSSLLMRRALEYAKAFDLLVISHAEDLALSQGGLMNEGYISTLTGMRGIPSAAEEVMVARDILLAEMTEGKLHIAHVSTEGSVRLIREAKKRGIAVSAETAPHYFSLIEDELLTFDTVYKMNPPLRRREDLEAVKAGLADGTIDVIATDHAPHSILEKDIEFDLAANGVIGLESAVPLVLELVREGVLTPTESVSKLSTNPARLLGRPLGSLRKDSPANVTVIDPSIEYVLDVETFRSKSRNCPFHGRKMAGRVLLTMVDGKIAFTRMEQ